MRLNPFLLASFMQTVERNFEAKINVVQSDDGKEFSFLMTKLGALGITHTITYPNSSAQNGAIECRNRIVVEIGLALLFHANMPLKIWIYVFRTTIFCFKQVTLEGFKFLNSLLVALWQKSRFYFHQIFWLFVLSKSQVFQ